MTKLPLLRLFKYCLTAFVLLAIGNSASSANTQAQCLEVLLNSETRPTMLESKNCLQNIDIKTAIQFSQDSAKASVDKRINVARWTDILLAYGPRLIAKLEKAYPGATWAFLGRDGMAFADMLEAFYDSIGQKNRVVRIEVSKDSFKNISGDFVISYLKNIGYNIDKFQTDYPFIMIDPVSKGAGRQGRTLLSYMLEHLKYSDRSIDRASEKIGFVGLIVSTFGGKPSPINYKQKRINEFLKIYEQDPSRFNQAEFFKTFPISTIAKAANQANEAGYVHFVGAWGDSFGKFYQSKNGTLTEPGEPFDSNVRSAVLWAQAKIWQSVSAPKFFLKVTAAAKKINYQFPITRPNSDGRTCKENLGATKWLR